MSIKTDKSFQFRGKTFFSRGRVELLKNLKNSLSRLNNENDTLLVFTPNPEQIMLAESDQEFNKFLLEADVLVPDGVGLTIAAQLLGEDKNEQQIERIPGRLLVEDLIKISKEDHYKILIIGGRDYSHTGSVSINNFEMSWDSGYLDAFNPTEGEEVALQKRIEQEKPDIIFVAFGAPMQEKWLVKHKDFLSQNNVRLGMVVGGTFDYLLGFVPSPPSWVSKMGFEWLFRLVTQPWRFKRQLKLISFLGLVIEEKWQAM
ncbi:MAG: WecB/TagA/CpsF family glycosyltransferase [Candidatus Pacebacteria bacterium]|nr:WecB/TagA/CpsF family glycosyltransferase [Candidatus Paceibacterota bacterium]